MEYDIEVERDWKLFIKSLDVEKKPVQACFTSLVVSPYATQEAIYADMQNAKARGDPRHHQPRAGPSAHLPRAHRHYDTSDTRHGWQPPPAPAIYQPGDLWRDSPSSIPNAPTQTRPSYIPPRPQLATGPGRDSGNVAPTLDFSRVEAFAVPPGITDGDTMYRIPFFPPTAPLSAEERAQREINEQSARDEEIRDERYEMTMPYADGSFHREWSVADQDDDERNAYRVTSPEYSDYVHVQRPRRPFSPQPLASDADTPLSLSGVRGLRAPDNRPRRIIRRPISPTESDDNDGVDGVDYAFGDTYPLFAPLDDLGPLPADEPLDMFDHDPDEAGFPTWAFDVPRLPRPELGYVNWSPPVPSTLDDLARRPLTHDSVVEYNQRARQAVDAQVASDRALTAPRNPLSSTNRPSVREWADYDPLPVLGRRQRDSVEEENGADQGEASDFLRRVRPRSWEEIDQEHPYPTWESISVGGRPPRARLSLGPGSLPNRGDHDNRRNGLVFDAESYLNPDL